MSNRKEVFAIKTNINRGEMNTGTKEIERNKSARMPTSYVQKRGRTMILPGLSTEGTAAFSLVLLLWELFWLVGVFFQVANVCSAAYLTDGCFATHHL